ncbi:MAG TPA: mechanosensitive ion channel, partial [Verrucomicrobiae bacterium]|nr:mechanosensitive ion channel [Verrucomicrobiae bacterium]
MNDILEQLREQFAAFGPNLLAGLAILVFGWLLALIASFIVRKALSKVSLDNKIAQWMAGPEAKGDVPIEQWAGKVVFYLIMLLVVIAFLETIKLTMATEPLNDLLQPMVAYLPHLVGAVLLLLIAWVVAIVFKNVLLGILKATKLDEKLGAEVAGNQKPMALSRTFAEVVYWLVFLLFLPAILQALQIQSLLEPVISLFNKVFTFLPNIFSAAAILVVGWFIARIVQRIVENLLASAGADRLSETWGISASLGKQKFSRVVGLALYFLILVPVLIAGLDALQLTAITQPATDMLAKVLNIIPNVLGALIVILLAVFIGKIVSGIVTNVLAGLGFDRVPVKLGLAKETAQGKQTPSAWIGTVV